jgi:hypothetical protein
MYPEKVLAAALEAFRLLRVRIDLTALSRALGIGVVDGSEWS